MGENVRSLTEDMARFSFTTDTTTVNLWPAIIVMGLLALAIIPLYEFMTTGSAPDIFSESKNSYYTDSQGYTTGYEGYRTLENNSIAGLLESIDTGAMAERMKAMAGKVRQGVSLFKSLSQINE